MANTATQIDTIYGGIGGGGPEKVYIINIDTTGTDLVVETPSTTVYPETAQRIYVVGQVYSEGTAANLQYISQSPTTLSGTVAITTGSRAITGTGTNFSAKFAGAPPYKIVVLSASSVVQTLTILTVTSATAMTATTSSTVTKSGKTFKRNLVLAAPELATNQGIYDKVGQGYAVATLSGEALVVQ